eukprot:3704442-Pleurochrysis_carterae.AAC.2
MQRRHAGVRAGVVLVRAAAALGGARASGAAALSAGARRILARGAARVGRRFSQTAAVRVAVRVAVGRVVWRVCRRVDGRVLRVELFKHSREQRPDEAEGSDGGAAVVVRQQVRHAEDQLEQGERLLSLGERVAQRKLGQHPLDQPAARRACQGKEVFAKAWEGGFSVYEWGRGGRETKRLGRVRASGRRAEGEDMKRLTEKGRRGSKTVSLGKIRA